MNGWDQINDTVWHRYVQVGGQLHILTVSHGDGEWMAKWGPASEYLITDTMEEAMIQAEVSFGRMLAWTAIGFCSETDILSVIGA